MNETLGRKEELRAYIEKENPRLIVRFAGALWAGGRICPKVRLGRDNYRLQNLSEDIRI